MKNLLAAALIAALFGCASSGPKIDPSKLGEIRAGQTTANEIYSRFGRPDFLSKNMDGSQTAVYVRAEDGTGGSVGGVLGSFSGSTETVTFSFDAKGVLSEYKYTPAGASRVVPAAAAAPQPAGAAAATATTGSTTTAAPAAAAAAVQSSSTGAAPATKPARDSSGVPYLWDILRNSTAKDPRNP
jgi:hypothetical protein